MAEGLMRRELQRRDRNDLTTASAGTDTFGGSKASEETLEILQAKEAPLEGFESQPVTEQLVDTASLVFVMTQDHREYLQDEYPQYSEKYNLLGEFSDGSEYLEDGNVPDPIGVGIDAYENVAEVMESAIPNIIAFVDSEG